MDTAGFSQLCYDGGNRKGEIERLYFKFATTPKSSSFFLSELGTLWGNKLLRERQREQVVCEVHRTEVPAEARIRISPAKTLSHSGYVIHGRCVSMTLSWDLYCGSYVLFYGLKPLCYGAEESLCSMFL